jgi:hypothetical protein
VNSRPLTSEFAPYCAKYIALVPDGDFLANFESETSVLLALLDSISEKKSLFRYAAGKWSIREMILHVADVERIQSYRVLRFARGDTTELPGFDPASYIAPSRAENRTWKSILDEFAAVRAATLELFRNLPDEVWSLGGVADGYQFTVRGIAYTIAGHAIHHRKLLSERYLAK